MGVANVGCKGTTTVVIGVPTSAPAALGAEVGEMLVAGTTARTTASAGRTVTGRMSMGAIATGSIATGSIVIGNIAMSDVTMSVIATGDTKIVAAVGVGMAP